ncbi:ribonuclease III [Saccharophagus degradans]|uniref:Ribonuclease 3 n=2 Tax=Saccharophagus degradans TaxID=86304 RepID=Q21IH6_SACD2|nr:ribonuclease III [Saccharophagus degradans]ABD81503.1 RNAse III [Saccharophagus degradans 2-40]MBU2985917.1 ribonuclease III [Saccharophagus degradans]MDO6420946.1 ribonuclease III [Saccharophagus degradans]MDO6606143.1 ribonuclease III [Saccharophagus degradans]WGP00263.1 ribonuclease III [Saccharophagus degradans]
MNQNDRLVARLGYTFKDKSLLKLALSHRSYGKQNNERVEFLGDSLLNFIIAEALFAKFPTAKEGQLTQLRANLVKGETLAEIAREFGLGDFLLLGEGELKSGGFRRASILADAVEALIGAIYLDSNSSMPTCRERVLAWYATRLDKVELKATAKDAKTLLQEYLQERKMPLPTYTVLAEGGEAHSRQFTVECTITGKSKPCSAVGNSKRIAEKLAAEKMLSQLTNA